MQSRASHIFAFVLGIVLAVVAFKVLAGNNPMETGGKHQVLQALSRTTVPQKDQSPANFVRTAAAKLEPAVVDVHTQGRALEPGNDSFFRMFGFPNENGGGGGGNSGGGDEQIVPTKGAGSGVIISADGYILTNNHVVADTTKVTVTVSGKSFDAKVIGADPASDIAVVKINPGSTKLAVAELGNSDDVHVGDWAIAIGNPLDVGTTVTLGIISAVNRTGLSAEGHSLNSVIQTDAAINPGNSGGALANADGQVVGINEAIASPTGAYVGIGFAIPINNAKKMATELIEHGKVVRPYLGVAYEPLKGVGPDARSGVGINVKGDDGVVVTQVFEGSPAEKAGLQKYDVILEANRQKITDTNSLNELVQKSKPGDKIVLLVSRNGQNTLLTAALKEAPANFGQQPARPRRQPRGFSFP